MPDFSHPKHHDGVEEPNQSGELETIYYEEVEPDDYFFGLEPLPYIEEISLHFYIIIYKLNRNFGVLG